MEKKYILNQIQREVHSLMSGEGTGHDWYHVERVLKSAQIIGRAEKADLFVVQLAALLHELGDWKFHDGDDTQTTKVPRQLMKKYHVDTAITEHVCDIIKHMSYRGGKNPPLKTIEGKVVQDADRLDSLGAMGIARCLATGGKRGRPIYDPNIKFKMHFKSKEEYFKYQSTSINHFYEKLLLLKDKMNTKTGRRLAEPRHQFLKTYLRQFHKEWKGV